MLRFSKISHEPVANLNITPLLDLAWVMLVIFVLATTAGIQGIDVELPQSSPNQTQVEPASRTISILSNGTIYLDNKKITLPELEKDLIDLKKVYGDKLPLIIKGDRRVEYRYVRGVFDVLKRVPIKTFSLVTIAENQSRR